jgi:hypothetical protein
LKFEISRCGAALYGAAHRELGGEIAVLDFKVIFLHGGRESGNENERRR